MTTVVGALAILAAIHSVTGCARKSEESKAPEAKSAPAPGPISGSAGKLHVDDGGAGGVPIVFVHSFGGSTAHWNAQLAHFRKTQRVVALDLRGHGSSDAPADGDYKVSSLAGDIGAVVDGLDLPRFVLVGHSMGGSAAIEYAGAHPERVAGLVLVGTPGQTPPEQGERVMASLVADYDKTMEGYWKSLMTGAQPAVEVQLHGEMGKVPREATLAIIGAIFEYDPLPALDRYSGPKLIIDTGHGESPRSLHSLVPQIPRQVIAGTSHWPHMDKPDEFDRILDEFLATIPPAPLTP